MKSALTVCLATLTVAVSAMTDAADAARRPNVLFIAVDDLNTRIGCYGDPVAKTPNLDRLARSGVRFERAYCQFPLCNPSRMSLLLGRYPTTTEEVDFCYPALLQRDWVTLPQHFRNNGYEVRLQGKIFHFDKDLMKSWFHEEVPGAEYPPDWTAGDKWVLKSQEVHAQMLADLTRWEPYRCLSPPPTGWVKSLRTWANVFGPVPDVEEQVAATKAKAYEWTADVKNAKQAVELLTHWAASDKPFFLGVGFYKPHVPLVAPQRFFDLYQPEKMPLPADFAPTPTADDSFMDEQLGRLLDALERLKLRDNTVIVLWGDHGWHLGEKGMWGKGSLFDVSARAPLIVVDPRREAAVQGCPRTVEFVDIYPMLAELCGLAAPPGLEGKSLVPLLDDPQAVWDKPAFTLVAREDWLGRSVRTDRWCYIEWDEGRRGAELYDLQADPQESRNLAKAPESAATVAELSKLLHVGPVAKESPVRAAALPKIVRKSETGAK